MKFAWHRLRSVDGIRRAISWAASLLRAARGRVVAGVASAARAVVDAVVGPANERALPAAPETRLALALVLVVLSVHVVRACERGGGPLVLEPLEFEPLRVDPNLAPIGELLLVPGVGPVIAERIRRLRAKQRFRTLEDLQTVHGIGPVMAERMRHHVLLDDP